ncbi:hypothetical protein PF001_g15852 [Phytophthora fragariae]|uniref:Integrase catalytic domain-containing protein n=1 Tax=Phytophthora fragariae TaxID=53985 RepID=A0A6A4CXR3_9STRA|nr:hypothetical protein PF001_g15852 [Phytophthora fragariae]
MELLAAGHRIKSLTSDGGGEFVNTELKLFMEARGIRFVPTHPYIPEENALVEKLNGVLVNKMRAAMYAADLPNRLWPEVLQYIVNIDNMSPTRALKGKTPSEKLLGTAPNMAKIRVCGSVGFVFVAKAKRKHKLCPKAEPALLLGFARSTTGYRLLHLRIGPIVEARDVKFREDITVSRKYISALLMGKSGGDKIPFVPLPVEYVAEESVRTGAEKTVTSSLFVAGAEMGGADADGAPGSGGESSSSGSDESDSDSAGNLETPPAATSRQATAATGSTASSATGGTTAAASANADPSAVNTGQGSPAPAATGGTGGRRQTRRQRMQNAGPPRRSTRTRRPNVRLNGYQLMLEEQLTGAPDTVDEVLRSPQRAEWQAALQAEFESLLKHGTWKLVDRSKSSSGKRVKVLTTKWVLRIKRDENSNILRYKARLVIHGFKQRFGFEYWDTYSPVVRIVTMLLVLLIELLLGLDARHNDVETAFLNSLLRGVTIYVEQPKGFDGGTGRVCLLLKGIYGLKQAARIWYQTLRAHLVEIGFRRCAFDVGLYVRYIYGRIVLVTVYVDDMMVIGKPHDIDSVIEELRQRFVMKDLGRVKHLLSMEIHYEPGRILCLSQSAYIDRLLREFGMTNTSTAKSPQMHNEKMLRLEKDKSKVNDPALPYRQLVGKLQYLVSCTRPDIANAVRCLGRHAGAYTKENFTGAKRVLQYLAGTRTHGLVYRRPSAVQDGKLQLYAYSDADHANCPDTSRSISGHVLKLNNWSFGFKSKKQNAVTDGTWKSELVAASTCVENLLWAKELLEEIGMTVEVPKLFIDNQSALKVCQTVGNYEGVKRYAKLGHKIAELVEAKELTLEYVPTSENIADMFTKALGPQRFALLRELVGVEDVTGAKLQQDQDA